MVGLASGASLRRCDPDTCLRVRVRSTTVLPATLCNLSKVAGACKHFSYSPVINDPIAGGLDTVPSAEALGATFRSLLTAARTV